MRTASVLVTCIIAAGCFGEPTRPSEPEPPPIPRQPGIAMVLPANSGAGQVAPVASYLPQPFRVRVMQDGQPVAGIAIRWAHVNPSGRVEPLAEVSDSEGYVAARYFTATTSGDQGVVAILGNQWLGFRITALPGLPAVLRHFSPAIDSVELLRGGFVTARVEDRFGNGVPQVQVNWQMNFVDGTNGASTMNSGPGGLDSAFVWLGTPGTATVIANLPGYSGIQPISFQVGTIVSP